MPTGFQRGSVPALLLLTWLGLPAAGGPPPEPTDEPPGSREAEVAEGRFLYRLYCRSCHGETAAGDGPMAGQLRIPPADLTRIRERNDGRFPSEDVRRRIDGRFEVPAHGPSDMPVWGLAFQQRDTDVDQEAGVRRRIDQLVAYLESVQVGEP